jgi:hypothetical protein
MRLSLPLIGFLPELIFDPAAVTMITAPASLLMHA